MAFCIHCGSEVASDATFCHSCGNALQAAGAEAAPPPEPVGSAEAPVESGASWTSESQVDSGVSRWASSPEPDEASWGTPTPSSSWASSTPEGTETPQTVDSGASSWGTSESSWSAPQSTWGTPESTAPLAEPEPAPPGSWTPTAPATPAAETSSRSAPTPAPPPAETGWPPSLSSSSSSSSASAVVPATPAAGVPNYLVASIVTTVLSMACCGCLPIGAISLIFAAQANSKAALGLADEAIRNAGLARTWLIVAWVLMGVSLLLWVGYFALILVAANL